MSRTHEDMDKEELITLVKRLGKQNNEWYVETKRLTEFRDRVFAAFVELPMNKRSLTYLLNELGYLNHYSRTDYLEGLHPHALGLYELKDEWMNKAQRYLESEQE